MIKMLLQIIINTAGKIYRTLGEAVIVCIEAFDKGVIQNFVADEKVIIGDSSSGTDMDESGKFLCSKLTEDFSFIRLILDKIKIVWDGKRKSNFHGYHILDPSPWPFFTIFAVFTMMMGIVISLHKVYHGEHVYDFIWIGLLEIAVCSFLWWDDVVYESMGDHTYEIRYGLKIGMMLFIVSEVMFFFSFFWAFFHLSLSPSIFVGSVWPPIGLSEFIINPYGVPLLNTVILLSSGVTVTVVHYYINGLTSSAVDTFYRNRIKTLISEIIVKIFRKELELVGIEYGLHEALTETLYLEYFIAIRTYSLSRIEYIKFLVFTVALACLFTSFQFLEYLSCQICLSDGIYGSTFYMLTGFHGLHVLIGTIFLAVCLVRAFYGHFEDGHYVGLECAIWYWHFVDVVWLFLYIFVYIWGRAVRVVGIYTNFEYWDYSRLTSVMYNPRNAYMKPLSQNAMRSESPVEEVPMDPLPPIEVQLLVINRADEDKIYRRMFEEIIKMSTNEDAKCERLLDIFLRLLCNNEYRNGTKTDFAVPGQISFQDPASFVMENIILLHNYVMFFLILIFSLVVWFFVNILIVQKYTMGYNYIYIETLNNYHNFRSDLMGSGRPGARNRLGSSNYNDRATVDRIREI